MLQVALFMDLPTYTSSIQALISMTPIACNYLRRRLTCSHHRDSNMLTLRLWLHMLNWLTANLCLSSTAANNPAICVNIPVDLNSSILKMGWVHL